MPATFASGHDRVAGADVFRLAHFLQVTCSREVDIGEGRGSFMIQPKCNELWCDWSRERKRVFRGEGRNHGSRKDGGDGGWRERRSSYPRIVVKRPRYCSPDLGWMRPYWVDNAGLDRSLNPCTVATCRRDSRQFLTQPTTPPSDAIRKSHSHPGRPALCYSSQPR